MPKKLAGQKAVQRGRNRSVAMSHPVRAQALRLLVERGEMSPKEIANEIGEEVPNVSYHLRRLVDLDCAEMVRIVPVEGKGAVEHFYVATERHMVDTEDWDELEPMVGEDILDEIMQKFLDDFVASRKAGIIGADSDFHLSRTPLLLDEQGVKEAMENSERWRLEQSEIEARSAARRAKSGEAAVPVSSSLAFYKVPRAR
jgi:DNA-binding transcriptional ArsR family regulator